MRRIALVTVAGAAALGLAATALLGTAAGAGPPPLLARAEAARGTPGSPFLRRDLAPASPRLRALAAHELARRSPLIVGGQPAEPGFWTSTVGLVLFYPDGIGFCTGSVFGARWILTAGHCIADALAGVAITGSYNLDDPLTKDVGIEAAFLYDSVEDDVAFLRTDEALTVAGIRLMRMPEVPLAAPGTSARIAGWGVTATTATIQPNGLLEATVPIVDTARCVAVYGSDFDGARMICAGGRAAGTCFGDSGGPLVVQAQGRPILAGVTSFGPETGCGISGSPDAYMAVAAYAADIAGYLSEDPEAPAGPPAAAAGSASEVTQTSATVAGTIDPKGLATDFYVVYARGTSVGRRPLAALRTPTQYAATAAPASVEARVTGLKPGTSYAFRIVGVNGAGETASSTGTFRTARDTRSPAVRALPSSGRAGARVALKYRVHDDFSTTTKERIRVYDGTRVLTTINGRRGPSEEGVVYELLWKTPAFLVGRFRFCVESTDESGNRSAPSCAAVRLT
jgi:secreted trypsin-like serine protease